MASDDFNRANESPIASPWSAVSGKSNLRIVSNALQNVTGSTESAAKHTSTALRSDVVVATVGSVVDGGPAVCIDGSGNFYAMLSYDNTNIFIFEFPAATQVGSSVSGTFTAGQTMSLRREGNDLVGYRNGVEVIRVTDTTTMTGNSGVFIYAGDLVFDSWTDGAAAGGSNQEISDIGSRRNRPGRGPYSLGRYFRPNVDAFPSVANVTSALSGQAGTSALGTLTPSTSIALSGQAITVSAGTLTAALAKALTGQAATASAGTLAPALSLALSGQAITLAQGTITASTGATAALSGQAITLAAGTILPTLTIALTGSQANFAAGTVSAGNDVTRALSGQQVDAASGTLTYALSKALGGQAATFAQGTVTPQQGFVVALTGQSFSATQGTLALSVSAVLTGQSVQATAGTIGVQGQIPPSDARLEYQAIGFNQSGFDQRGIDQGYYDAR